MLRTELDSPASPYPIYLLRVRPSETDLNRLQLAAHSSSTPSTSCRRPHQEVFVMGCVGSKAMKQAVSSDMSAPPAEAPPATQENEDDVDAQTTLTLSGLPASKVPPTLARDVKETRNDEARWCVRLPSVDTAVIQAV